MMVGTPSVCAYRGGMTDLLTDKVNGFTYDFPEYPQLALRIMELFEDDALAKAFPKRQSHSQTPVTTATAIRVRW